MLEEIVDRAKIQKRIAVCTSSEDFTQVLEHLLGSWGFEICQSEDPSVLLLGEEGCCKPLPGQQSICLSRSGGTTPGQILLPVSLESLWSTLEEKFHRPIRMHLRMLVNRPTRVFLRGMWFDTVLNSLSDMGTRFITDQEMLRGEPVTIPLKVDGEVRRYRGEVIFSMAVGSSEAKAFQSGVVFVDQNKETCDKLRHVLIRWHLEAVRKKMASASFQNGLAFLDLAPEVKAKLIKNG